MKAITGKMLISLVGVMVAAPFILIALVAGARAIELAQNAQDDALLIVLAMCGAVISMINGFGRRTQKAQSKAVHHTALASREAPSGKASAVNLGY
ncbi:MAG TPA: hypothetical protein VF717_16465 [Pyrinomonadaceae bacterium]|jgi:hypothetical protein